MKRVLRDKKCNMELVQHEKSATRKKCNIKECNMEKVQRGNNET